jgi:Pin2-interacting protein X1
MGLAAPRNKRKIAADPRNLTWSANASSTSVGHKLMTRQGWSEGQSLGSRSTSHLSGGTLQDENAARLAAARVGVIFKDDTLGLGAKLRSKDVEAQKTGMDAFVGLLGRLNAKGAQEEAEVERKEEEKKLERYARGRWGGMMFVPGGVLVGGEEFGTKKEARERKEREEREEKEAAEAAEEGKLASGRDEDKAEETKEERAKRKEEKRQRKEQRRLRREAKAAKRSRASSKATSDVDDDGEETSRSPSRSRSKSKKRRSKPAPDEPVSSASEPEQEQADEVTSKNSKKRKRLGEASSSTASTPLMQSATASPAPSPRPLIRTGRALLRGRNIEAKRKAFQDAKGLDGIFMRAGA